MSYRREIPKLNRDNFKAWQEFMKLHLETIGDKFLKLLDNKYVAPLDSLIMDQMVQKKSHNTMMIEISSTLNYFEFD